MAEFKVQTAVLDDPIMKLKRECVVYEPSETDKYLKLWIPAKDSKELNKHMVASGYPSGNPYDGYLSVIIFQSNKRFSSLVTLNPARTVTAESVNKARFALLDQVIARYRGVPVAPRASTPVAQPTVPPEILRPEAPIISDVPVEGTISLADVHDVTTAKVRKARKSRAKRTDVIPDISL